MTVAAAPQGLSGSFPPAGRPFAVSFAWGERQPRRGTSGKSHPYGRAKDASPHHDAAAEGSRARRAMRERGRSHARGGQQRRETQARSLRSLFQPGNAERVPAPSSSGTELRATRARGGTRGDAGAPSLSRSSGQQQGPHLASEGQNGDAARGERGGQEARSRPESPRCPPGCGWRSTGCSSLCKRPPPTPLHHGQTAPASAGSVPASPPAAWPTRGLGEAAGLASPPARAGVSKGEANGPRVCWGTGRLPRIHVSDP